jgi:hypothetical protein
VGRRVPDAVGVEGAVISDFVKQRYKDFRTTQPLKRTLRSSYRERDARNRNSGFCQPRDALTQPCDIGNEVEGLSLYE